MFLEKAQKRGSQGESNFCQNCIKGFPLKNCNKKGTKSFAKSPQGRRAHLTRELCSATTDIKDRAGSGILVLQSCCTAPWTQERAQRNLLQTAPVSPEGIPAFWAAGHCLAQAKGLQSRHHTRHVVKAFSSASESPHQATAAGARKETKITARWEKSNSKPPSSLNLWVKKSLRLQLKQKISATHSHTFLHCCHCSDDCYNTLSLV